MSGQSTYRIRQILANPVSAIVAINVLLTVSIYCGRLILEAAATTGSTAFSAFTALGLPSDPAVLLHRPWTIVTYMFTQYDLLQLICNMLWLWMFGRMLMMVATGTADKRRIWALYIGGGLCGGLCFIGYTLLSHTYSTLLLGASAATLAVIAATALRLPDMRVNLILFGPVKLKWIAAAALAYFILAGTAQSMASAAAHIGGALFGVAFVMCTWQRRRSVRSAPKTKPAKAANSRDDDEEFDRILAKISASGYSSLTAAERRILVKYSNNLNRK